MATRKTSSRKKKAKSTPRKATTQKPQAPAFDEDPLIFEVGYEMSMTINLGNFESARFQLSARRAVGDSETARDAYDALAGRVEREMQYRLDAFILEQELQAPNNG